jgi:anti-sigma factor RsiW
MKTETLDSLLLDHSLGELTPAVRELLDAYLAHEPAHAARAQRLAATTALARAAVVGRPVVAPDLKSLPPWRVPRDSRSWFNRGEVIRLAACLALGAIAGWSAYATRMTARASTTGAPVTPPVLVDTEQSSASGFWSVAALARQETTRPAVNRIPGQYRLRWDSPGKMPHLEEKL